MMPQQEQIDFRKNSLNTFRLFAALEVLCGHVVIHLHVNYIPILSDFIGLFWGVPLFFTLSGYLIWHSIGNSKTFGNYLKKRFWRIYPELWVAVGAEIVVLLLLYHQAIDWPKMGLFIVGQATIFQFWTPDFLRDYGCGTPNGALWTITVLIQFYVCAYALYKLLKNSKLAIWTGTILVTTVIGWLTSNITCHLPEVIGKLYGVSIFPYLWMFIIAAFIAEYREIIMPFIKIYWWLFITLLLLFRGYPQWEMMAGLYPVFKTILLFCGVLGFSYQYPEVNMKTDISYGIYIYHMTIVNALIALGFVGKQWSMWVVVAITCILAYLSTITVGQMSANKKKVLTSST